MSAVRGGGSSNRTGLGSEARAAISCIFADNDGDCVRTQGGGTAGVGGTCDTTAGPVVSGVGDTISENVIRGGVCRDGSGDAGDGGVCSGTPLVDTGVVADHVTEDCER